MATGFLIKDKRGLTAVAIVSRRVGAGIERPVGSTAVGKKSAKRNELGNPNDTLETLSCLIKSKERPQVVANDYRMLLCKVTVKLGHSFHLSFLYKSRRSSIVEHQPSKLGMRVRFSLFAPHCHCRGVLN